MKTEGLKVGTRVLVRESHGWHGCRHKPGTVKKTTASGIVMVSVDAYPPHGTIAYEKIFNPDGRERARGYHGDSIEEFSQETLDAEIHAEMVDSKRRALENVHLWRKLPDSVILQVSAIVDAVPEAH